MAVITWTKSWSSSDDGTPFGGADIQNIQNDITTAVNGGIGGTNLSSTITVADATLIDLSAIVHNDASPQGLMLPQIGASPTSPSSGEGYIGWDQTNNTLEVYDGSSWTTIGSVSHPASTAQGDILYYSATATLARLGAGSAGQHLQTNGTSANPSWSWTGCVQAVGSVAVSVATGATVMPCDDTIPQITEGDEYMTQAITPKGASNKLKIDVVFNGASDTASRYITVALFQDATANALAAVSQWIHSENNRTFNISLTYYMTTGTTSSTTFRVRAGVDTSGTITFNGNSSNRILGGVCASSITILEVA